MGEKNKSTTGRRTEQVTTKQVKAVYDWLCANDYIGGCCDDPDWKEVVREVNQDLGKP